MRLCHYSDVENAADDPERLGRLAGAIERARDETTLVCDTGDSLAPGVLSMATDGRAVLPFFERVAPDVATFGNHDFDVGVTALRSVVADAPQTWVTANLQRDGDVFCGDLGVETWTVEPVGDERVGVFGLTDPRTLGEHVVADELTVRDPVPAARDAVSALRDADVDRIVCLSHLGDPDAAIADACDVVLDGHQHSPRLETVEGAVLTRPGARADRLAVIDVADDGVRAAFHPVPDAPVEDGVVAALEATMAEHDLLETVTTVAGGHERTRRERFPESVVGNTVVDAYRAAVGADVAVCNVGMLRSGPPFSGAVSVGALQGLTPFDNEVWTADLDGDELRELFAAFSGVRQAHSPNELLGHVSGAALTWTWTDAGVDLVDATVAGEPLAADRSYTVAAPTFLFTVEDWPHLTRERASERDRHQHDALVAYVREHGFSPVDGRMTAVDAEPPPSTHSLR